MATQKLIPSHTEIERRFKLLKLVNKSEAVLVSELATELSIKKTDLMQIILDNPMYYTWREGFKTGKAIITSITP